MWRRVLVPWLLLAAVVQAEVEVREFADEHERARFQVLAGELRCPKCQNQNLFDSDAPIARDLREVLHEQIRAGRTDDEIVQYMTDRYGEFVRYRPDWHGPALLIWVLPGVLLLLGLWVVWRQLRRAGGGED